MPVVRGELKHAAVQGGDAATVRLLPAEPAGGGDGDQPGQLTAWPGGGGLSRDPVNRETERGQGACPERRSGGPTTESSGQCWGSSGGEKCSRTRWKS